MRTFSVYRPKPPEGYVEGGFAVEVEKPQFQGVVFDDGTVAIRWFTLNGSTALWPSLEDLEQIHGHPEYGTRWVWGDNPESPALSDKEAKG